MKRLERPEITQIGVASVIVVTHELNGLYVGVFNNSESADLAIHDMVMNQMANTHSHLSGHEWHRMYILKRDLYKAQLLDVRDVAINYDQEEDVW